MWSFILTVTIRLLKDRIRFGGTSSKAHDFNIGWNLPSPFNSKKLNNITIF